MEVDGCDKLQTDQAEASKPWYVITCLIVIIYFIHCYHTLTQLNSALNKYSAISDMAAQFFTILLSSAEYLSLMRIFSVTFANIMRTVNHILPQTIFFWLYFRSRQCESNFNYCDVISPQMSPISVK